MARREKAVLAVSRESIADTKSPGHGVGKAQAVNLGRGGWLTRHFCKVYKGCNMFKSMPLKRILGEMGRLGNTMKKRSIKISAKKTYWHFRDIELLKRMCRIY